MLVFEGLDGSGKSYIAEHIQKLTGWHLQPSEGPEKYPGEIVKRIMRYNTLPRKTIFDRHPLISQYIYGALKPGSIPPPVYLLQEFKRLQPFVIEARNNFPHILKDHDTMDHLKIVAQRPTLARLYSEFFDMHFPLRHVYTGNFDETVQLAVSHAREENARVNG